MGDDPEIRRAARFLLKKYGIEAEGAVARCADTLEAAGERDASSYIRQVLNAIIEMRKRRPCRIA